jgi:membrane protease YdiL (CAAX protease family)
MNTIVTPPAAQTVALQQHPLLLGFAWLAMLLLSRLPQIILKEFFAIGIPDTGLFLGTALMALVLLAFTYLWPMLQPLRGYLLVMAVTALLIGPLDSFLRNSGLWATWFGPERGWAIRFFGERLRPLIEAGVMLLVLIGMGSKCQDFFLTVGNLYAPAMGWRLPWLGNSWLWIGPLFTALLASFLFFGMAGLTNTPLATLPRVIPWLLAILLFAGMNAFGEEFLYRAAPLSQLRSVVGPDQAIWLTALWFGLGHYYGGIPSGAVGTAMAGGIALFFGKAMSETRGIVLPTLLHMLIDVAIFSFFALSAAGQ